jgi:UDP-glucuronate decarboxylase
VHSDSSVTNLFALLTLELNVLRWPFKAPANPQAKASAKKGDQKDYGVQSTYDESSNSVSYTTTAKFPPVKLLPNAERKRILGELSAQSI